MEYRSYQPSSFLTPVVRCYWSLEDTGDSPPEKQRIIPDGCMEMIFHFGDPYRQFLEDGSSILQPRCFVFGQITRPLEIMPTGRSGIFATRFEPEGFGLLDITNVKTMENRAVALEELLGREGREFGDQILNAGDHQNRIERIEEFLVSHLGSKGLIDHIAKSSVDLIFKVNGQTRIDDLSKSHGISRRQLERRFMNAVGLSPKQLSKVVRIQKALQKLADGNYSSLAELAAQNGYFDQAHFIRDFKEFTGISPRQFYSPTLMFSHLFSGTE